MRKGFWLVWHAIIWVIWKARNAKIFENHSKDVEEMVEEIKVLSWRWMLMRLKVLPCLFYEWNWDPEDCLRRQYLRGEGLCFSSCALWVGSQQVLLVFSPMRLFCYLQQCCCLGGCGECCLLPGLFLLSGLGREVFAVCEAFLCFLVCCLRLPFFLVFGVFFVRVFRLYTTPDLFLYCCFCWPLRFLCRFGVIKFSV